MVISVRFGAVILFLYNSCTTESALYFYGVMAMSPHVKT